MSIYSLDFKEKALEILAFHKNNARKVSLFLNVPAATLRRWKKIKDEEVIISNKGGGKRFEKINLEELKKYVDENPDKYGYEIAIVFNCNPSSINRALHKIGYSHKKNYNIQKAKTKRSKNLS